MNAMCLKLYTRPHAVHYKSPLNLVAWSGLAVSHSGVHAIPLCIFPHFPLPIPLSPMPFLPPILFIEFMQLR